MGCKEMFLLKPEKPDGQPGSPLAGVGLALGVLRGGRGRGDQDGEYM